MSLINIYLKETSLTSTRNKYIDENLVNRFESDLKIPRKRKDTFSQLLLGLPEKSILLSTENKFLINDYIPVAKKKKCQRFKRGSAEQLFADCIPVLKKKFRRLSKLDNEEESEESSSDTDDKLCWRIFCKSESSRSRDIDRLDISYQRESDELPRAQGDRACFGFSRVTCSGKSFAPTAPGAFRPLSAPGPALLFGSAPSYIAQARSYNLCSLSPPSLFSESLNIPETVIYEMPAYKLESIQLQEESTVKYFSSGVDGLAESTYDIKSKKLKLLNTVSMALMYSSNLKDKEDPYRTVLEQAADDVRLVDPEFILKIALYARQELQIRAVTNFLLSYAAVHCNTRMFLEKYFSKSIVLPTDWIEVAEYFQVFSDETKRQPFPAALRRAMKKAFSMFDDYQLAKYNRDKTKKKSLITEFMKDDAMEDSEDHISRTKNFTLKQLIRILHIDSPAESVLCLLGKKYPENQKSFQSCGLPGTWDSSKAGKRMKLPIPETWETQISAKGNKPEVWESLIENNKLPYMAMLRNLKNLIISGISPVHHKKVISYLENKKHVINSRQLPLQFYEAYKAVSSLKKMMAEADKNLDSLIFDTTNIPPWKRSRMIKKYERIKDVSVAVIEEYMDAITNALEISSLNNLYPIPGKTLIIIELPNPERNNKIYETCIMLGLMCLKACEHCKMYMLCIDDEPDEVVVTFSESFLNTVSWSCTNYKEVTMNTRGVGDEGEQNNIIALEKILAFYLKPRTLLSVKLDHIVFLRSSVDHEEYNMESTMKSFLYKYRQLVNPDMLYTNVNFSLSNKFTEDNSSSKDMYLCGSSSSLVKFIAGRSSGGQLTCVENIDMKYNLPELKASVGINADNLLEEGTIEPVIYKVPKWHTLRVFVSSTFKDMLSERDLLIRYVFPELKRRAASVFVRIAEIDFRWGITEEDSSTKRAAELCLIEAQNSDLFVGLIGDRYGTIYNFEPPDAPELEWVKDCPPGLSITELEIYAAALRNRNSKQKTSFFYFRDNSFMSLVPHKWLSHFSSEDPDTESKVKALKARIKANDFKVLDGYPCCWAGIFENKPILAGLDVLGATVLEDLWKAVQERHTADPFLDEISEEEMYHQTVIDSNSFFVGKKNSCIDAILKRIKIDQGPFVICGDIGSGKTTLMVNLLQNLNNYVVVKFFIGISPRSRNLSYMLQYICNYFIRHLPVSFKLPDNPDDIVNQFPDIILQAATCTGGRELILFIDGLEHLEKNGQRLDWLPLMLPNRVKMICSASYTSLAYKVLAERLARGSPIYVDVVQPLQQSDRELLVRNYLKYYRKSLDESAFNNNLLKIVTKKESSNPYYLRLACDFLRIYAIRENLLPMIQKLPSTVILVLQEVITRIENEYGSSLVQNALSLLCIAREGLEDNDIYTILSFLSSVPETKTTLCYNELKEKIKVLKPEQLLSKVKYCSLMHAISTFACGHTRQRSLSLSGTQFEKAIQKYYINKNYSSLSMYFHSVLSAYYHNICDPCNDEKYSGHSGVTIRGLFYHMLNGCLYQELSDMLCNCKFIEAVFRERADDELLEYYSLLLYDILPANQKLTRELNYQRLYSFYDFVSRNFYIFHRYSSLVMQQALNEPHDSLICVKAEDYNRVSLQNLSRNVVVDHRLTTISGFVKNVTALTSERLKPFVLLGSEDGYLKLLDLNSRKIIRNIKGHMAAITCICYAGKNRVCVSSVDGTLTLWDSVDFTQVAVLKGHRHNVTSCCADPSGCVLFSSGWDNSARLWSLTDGRSISVIDSFRSPVNCIDHHPTKQQIACGLWTGNIEIWDTISMKRKLEIKSSCGSVKSIAYTTDGFNIISAFIQSDVYIWSSEEGLKMSALKGHILPVTTLSCSLAQNVFVSGSDDCTLKVWASVSEPYFCVISECKNSSISLMEFISNDLLAVAFHNSEIGIFDIINGNLKTKFILESDVVSSFSTRSNMLFYPDEFESNWLETSVVFGCNSGKLMVGDILTSSISPVGNLTSKITAIIHNNCGIICGSAEGDIGIFTYPDDVGFKTLAGAHRSFITSLCVAASDEYSYFLSTSNDNTLKLWRLDLGNSDVTLHGEWSNSHRDSITCSVFEAEKIPESLLGECRDLFTGSYDNNILRQNGAFVYKGLQSPVLKIMCSRKVLLGCGNDGSMVLWNKKGDILTSVPGIEISSTPLAFHVIENESMDFEVTFAFVDKDGSIKVKKPLERAFSCSYEGHRKAIKSCCIADNGEVVSCSLDGSVNLWKLPTDVLDNPVIHTSSISGLALSTACDYALSSDVHGNLIVWKIDFLQTSPLVFATRKSYAGGFIKKLSWLKHDFICAVNICTEHDEKYFIEYLTFKNASSSLEVLNSLSFESEILCVDSCAATDVIVVGFKSGEVMLINCDSQKIMKICDDWILGLSFCSRETPSDLFCSAFVDGTVNLYSTSEFLKESLSGPTPFASYKPLNGSSTLITALQCGQNKMICCGDAYGNLKIFMQQAQRVSKKIHEDAVTGICIVGSYIFTSSLDRTVRVINITENSLKQVCQFHLHVPITCLVSPKVDVDSPSADPEYLLIGTTAGDVHVLKFHFKC